ncbi:MAG TPA: hypothetical protein VME45_16630 [Stellaceae bacterium]|nr:hypothetical protein [Stellaceae bacterium]
MIRIAFAVFVSLVLAASAALAACPPVSAKPLTAKERLPARHCVDRVNLGAVPAISADVVAAEPAPVVKPPTYSDPKPGAYQGPTVGLSKPDPAVRAVPTVGYKWSLE